MTEPNQILLMSFEKEMKELEKNHWTKVQNVMMDNVYITAINKAVHQVNSSLKKDLNVADKIIHSYLIHELLTDEDNLLLNKIDQELETKSKELREKYSVAKVLIAMADTFGEKLTILQRYVKNLPL